MSRRRPQRTSGDSDDNDDANAAGAAAGAMDDDDDDEDDDDDVRGGGGGGSVASETDDDTWIAADDEPVDSNGITDCVCGAKTAPEGADAFAGMYIQCSNKLCPGSAWGHAICYGIQVRACVLACALRGMCTCTHPFLAPLPLPLPPPLSHTHTHTHTHTRTLTLTLTLTHNHTSRAGNRRCSRAVSVPSVSQIRPCFWNRTSRQAPFTAEW
jgi:hypothetical protein